MGVSTDLLLDKEGAAEPRQDGRAVIHGQPGKMRQVLLRALLQHDLRHGGVAAAQDDVQAEAGGAGCKHAAALVPWMETTISLAYSASLQRQSSA